MTTKTRVVEVCDECGYFLYEGEQEDSSHSFTSHMMRVVDLDDDQD